MKTSLKRDLYAGLRRLGIYRLGRWWHRHRAVILTYHGVLRHDDQSYSNRNCVSAEMFDRQMEYLGRHYHVMPLPDLIRRLRMKEALPRYALAITFDDGFRNNYTIAAPILKKHKLPATVFLTTGLIDSAQLGLWTERVDRLLQIASTPVVELTIDGDVTPLKLATTRDRIIASDMLRTYFKRLPPRERETAITELAGKVGMEKQLDESLADRYAFLTWDEVRAMMHMGITFGSHTHTHSIMSTLSPAEAHFELEESRRLIQSELKEECRIFSYPNGTRRDFTARDRSLLKKLNYVAAVSQINGFNGSRTDVFALRRINITRSDDFNFFLAKVTGMWSFLKSMFKSI